MKTFTLTIVMLFLLHKGDTIENLPKLLIGLGWKSVNLFTESDFKTIQMIKYLSKYDIEAKPFNKEKSNGAENVFILKEFDDDLIDTLRKARPEQNLLLSNK